MTKLRDMKPLAGRINQPNPSDRTVPRPEAQVKMAQSEARHCFVGMWVTDDGLIRHELTTDGRYDEARGTRGSAYRGRYTVSGDHIDYVDDTGFTASGEFVDGALHHAGIVLRRSSNSERRRVRGSRS